MWPPGILFQATWVPPHLYLSGPCLVPSGIVNQKDQTNSGPLQRSPLGLGKRLGRPEILTSNRWDNWRNEPACSLIQVPEGIHTSPLGGEEVGRKAVTWRAISFLFCKSPDNKSLVASPPTLLTCRDEPFLKPRKVKLSLPLALMASSSVLLFLTPFISLEHEHCQHKLLSLLGLLRPLRHLLLGFAVK